jgi:hypothetical protein
MAEFYYRSGPNEYGPLAADELRQMAREGRAIPSGEVRRGKTGPWVPADRVQGLFVANSTQASAREPLAAAAAPPPVTFQEAPETEILDAESRVGVESAAGPADADEPDELSALGAIVDTEMVGEAPEAAQPAAPGLQTRKHVLLRRIARACRVLSGLCLVLALVGAAPAWILAQHRFESSLAGALAMLIVVGSLGLLAVALFSMCESIKLLIEIEQRTRLTYELLAKTRGTAGEHDE